MGLFVIWQKVSFNRQGRNLRSHKFYEIKREAFASLRDLKRGNVKLFDGGFGKGFAT